MRNPLPAVLLVVSAAAAAEPAGPHPGLLDVAASDIRAAAESGVPLIVDVVTMTSVRDINGRFLYARHDIQKRTILWWLARHGALNPGDISGYLQRGYLVEYDEVYAGTL